MSGNSVLSERNNHSINKIGLILQHGNQQIQEPRHMQDGGSKTGAATSLKVNAMYM